jgi:hypothetical protein
MDESEAVATEVTRISSFFCIVVVGHVDFFLFYLWCCVAVAGCDDFLRFFFDVFFFFLFARRRQRNDIDSKLWLYV